MKEQRCLYCERPLALLSRLTGDGEFCSKEHRRIYQKEHSQLALARLLQAQPSGPPAPGSRRGGEKERSPEPVLSEVTPQEVPVAVIERLTPKGRSSKDPEAARFVEMPEVEAAVWAVPAARASDPRWSELPHQFTYGKNGFPRFVNFVTPGAFLRRQSQPAPPSVYPGNLTRGGIAPAALSSLPPQTRLFEERLRSTERIGFCPP